MTNQLVVTVIPNWNLKQDLAECLDSLIKNSYAPHQIVVVDNGSTDGSVEFVKHGFPTVEVISLTQNLGYAGAINVGIKHALLRGAGYVFLLNNDTVTKPETINVLVDILERDPTIGIATPKILNYDNPQILFGLGDRIYRWFPVPLGFGYKKFDRPGYSRLMDFDYVTGCAMMLPVDVINKTGLCDLSYHMYYEDADYSRRVRNLGYRVVCVGYTSIYHKGSRSSTNIQATTTRTRARNRVFFYRRYPHGPHPSLTFSVLALIAIQRSFTFLIKRRRDLIRPYLEGLWTGWREPLPPPKYDWEKESFPDEVKLDV